MDSGLTENTTTQTIKCKHCNTEFVPNEIYVDYCSFDCFLKSKHKKIAVRR